MKHKIFIILIACSISISASAKFGGDGDIYIGVGNYLFDDSQNDDAISAAAGFELPIDKSLTWEFWFSRFNIERKANLGSSKVKRIYQGFLYHLNEGNTRAFVNAGLAHMKDVRQGSKDIKTPVAFGIGFKTYFENDSVIRGEIFTQNDVDIATRLSIGYSFGEKYKAPVEVVVIEPEPEPEPIPEPVPEPVPEPEPEPEPMDSDNDGVFDDTDQCPGTNIAFVVDETGCPVMLPETVSISMDIKFSINSAELTDESVPEVGKLADFLNQFDKTQVVIEGHTDSTGRDKYNKTLSQNRADSVMRILVQDFGISPERVTSVGYGEEQPIADNATVEGRASNRRVVAVVESTILKEATK